MVMSDFCADSARSIMTIIGPDGEGQARQLVSHYSSCSGSNPFNADISSAQSAILMLSGNITEQLSSSGNCPNEPNLINSQVYINDMHTQLGLIKDGLNCSSISPQYDR
jgi:hypothetical protein